MSDHKDERVEAERLWRTHIETAEPLDQDEVRLVVFHGFAKEEDWDDRGGNLFWHTATWPDPDAIE
ncbi:MAG: hypothetical protein ABFE08_16345 [Armatimonadia bacterium]